MSNASQKLSSTIRKFLQESEKSLAIAEKEPKSLKAKDLTVMADQISKMGEEALLLLEEKSDEMTWYNASLVKGLLDEPLELDEKKHKVSLMEAARQALELKNDTSLRLLLRAWTIESTLKEVLFEDLQQIAEELTA